MLDVSGRNEMKQIAFGQGSAFVNTGNEKDLNQHCFLTLKLLAPTTVGARINP